MIKKWEIIKNYEKLDIYEIDVFFSIELILCIVDGWMYNFNLGASEINFQGKLDISQKLFSILKLIKL